MSKIQRRFRRRWFFSYVRDESVVIPLELVDAPGGSADPVTSGQARSRLLRVRQHRAEQRDRVLPRPGARTGERATRSSTRNSVIHAVSQRLRDQGRLMPDGRLPHHVAICVAEFDEFPMVQDRPTVPDDRIRRPRCPAGARQRGTRVPRPGAPAIPQPRPGADPQQAGTRRSTRTG